MRAPLQEKREDDIMDWGHNMACWGLTTATGDDDNNVDGNGAMGNEVDNSDGAMGSGAARYDDDDNGDGR